MKKKARVTFYLPRRLFRILEDITPLFLDLEAEDPKRGAMTKALEYVIQQYMESDDYRKKLVTIRKLRWKLFVYLSDKEHKLRNPKE